ncbi:hypothetical protein PFISCL1PPCAC_28536, partial [Pristionchus fissidentatus]
ERTLVVGFSHFAPGFLRQGITKKKGIFPDLWQTVADQLGFENLEMRYFPIQRKISFFFDRRVHWARKWIVYFRRFCSILILSCLFSESADGVIYEGELERGVFAVGDFVSMEPGFPSNYSYSTPAVTTKTAFYEATRLAEGADPLSFIVFNLWTLALLAGSFGAIVLLDSLHGRYKKFDPPRGRIKIIHNVCHTAMKIIFLWGFFATLIVYNAFYGGNTLTQFKDRQTKFPALKHELRAHERILCLFKGGVYFDDDELINLTGGSKGTTYKEESCFEDLCSDRSTIALLNENVYAQFISTPIADACSLTAIAMPRGETTGFGWLDSAIQDGSNYHIIMGKDRRKEMEMIDKIIMTIYRNELMESIHLRRSLTMTEIIRMERGKPAPASAVAPFRPLSIILLSIPGELLGVGVFLSLLLLTVEIIHWRRVQRLLKKETPVMVDSVRSVEEQSSPYPLEEATQEGVEISDV